MLTVWNDITTARPRALIQVCSTPICMVQCTHLITTGGSLHLYNSREAKWRHACQQTARAVHTGNVWERSWHAESPNMADALVWLREGDVKGAKLPQTSVEKNTIDDLRRWLECRGLTSQKKESHAALVRRYGTVLLSMFSEKFRLIETDKCTCTE